MQIVPLSPLKSQIVTAILGGQTTQMNVYQKATGLFIDVYVANSPIVVGVICEDANRIVRSTYLGFIGDLAFIDTQGSDDPVYTGLGGRFQLAYLEAGDVPVG